MKKFVLAAMFQIGVNVIGLPDFQRFTFVVIKEKSIGR